MTEPQNYSTSFVVPLAPETVFDAINDVRSWWTGEIDGQAGVAGDVFTYRYADLHSSTQRVSELVPGRRVVWHVEAADLSFVARRDEWAGTDIVFEIAPVPGGSALTFTHVGLSPEIECYEMCSSGWRSLVEGRLRDRLRA